MKDQEFIQVRRNALITHIKEILSANAGLPKEEMKNANARSLVAGLAGQLAGREPEVSKALCELIQLKLIV